MVIINPVVKSRPWRTSGSHVWRGARPNLRARARVIMVRGKGCERSLIFHWPVIQAFIELAKRIIAAAVAWVRKYLVEASIDRG